MKDGEGKKGRLGNPRLKDVRAKGVVYTRAEKDHHKRVAEHLLGQSIGTPALVARTLMRELGIGPKRAKRVVEEVFEEWVGMADPRQAPRNRAQAIARVRKDLYRARYKQVGGAYVEREDPRYSAIARLEFLLMKLEGTDQPAKLEVDVRMNEATIGSISKLTAEQVREILAASAEQRRLADLARARLPECVDAEFDEADE